MLSTPAMNVVATAPSPGVSMPSFPLAGRMAEEDEATNYSPFNTIGACQSGVCDAAKMFFR
jgi:hypothetical protein